MLWAATMALVIQKQFARAAAWMAAAALLSALGIIHAWQLTPSGVEGRLGWWSAPPFALSYLAGAAFLLLCAWYVRRTASASVAA
jgi:AGZA family xanthine/uracil permease-like MFS transporter